MSLIKILQPHTKHADENYIPYLVIFLQKFIFPSYLQFFDV